MINEIIYLPALLNDGSDFYRMSGVLPYIGASRITYEDAFNFATYVGVNTLILQRPYSEEHVGIINLAQMMGVRVIVDYDDLATDIPKYNPAHKLYEANKENLIKCIRLANEIWVSTDKIKRMWLRYNKHIHVIPNAHNDYLFPIENKKSFNWDNKSVFYRGGETHIRDIRQYMNTMKKVMSENTDWQFMCLAIDWNDEFDDVMTDIDNCYITNPLPTIQYHRHLHEMNPTIMICPLENTELNFAKSNISWIEGTYAGSAFFGNKTLFEFNLPCILELSLLGKAISEQHISTLKDKNKQSWEYILDNLLLSNINELRKDRLGL